MPGLRNPRAVQDARGDLIKLGSTRFGGRR